MLSIIAGGCFTSTLSISSSHSSSVRLSNKFYIFNYLLSSGYFSGIFSISWICIGIYGVFATTTGALLAFGSNLSNKSCILMLGRESYGFRGADLVSSGRVCRSNAKLILRSG